MSVVLFKVEVNRLKGEPINNRETEDQQLWKQLPQTEGEERAELLIELAQQAIYRSSGSEALALAEEAHEIYKAMGARASSIAMANAITGIGYSLKELNRVDEATKALDGAIDLLRESGHPFMVDTLRTKASWHGEQGNWNAALEGYSEAARINEVDGCREFFARDLFNIAHCNHQLGNWQQVITYALRAREIFKEEKMVFEISWCDLNIADSHAELGDGEAAILWGRRANDIGTLRKDHEMMCKSSYVMARGHILLGKYDEAERLLNDAQGLVAGSSDWTQVKKVEKALISVYRSTGRDSDADEAERRLGTLQEIVE
jgi:tetratricopeptide (TPR) repeat protein